MKTKFKYSVDRSVYKSATIYTEDGGLSTIYHNGDRFITEYYQTRIANTSDEEIQKAYDGKVYSKEWPHKTFVDDEMIEDALHWLASSHIRFTEVKADDLQIKLEKDYE